MNKKECVQGSRRFTYVAMEFVERVEHVKSVHVNDGSVNCQLATIQSR